MGIFRKTLDAAKSGASGRRWYDQAKALIEVEAKRMQVEPEYFADLLAITSPRISVARNWYVAKMYVQHGSTETLMRNTIAAIRHYEMTGEIRGPKTSAFSAALRGDSNAIVLDTWMAAFFGVDHSEFSKAKVRAKYERLIRRVAVALGWQPAEVQAAVWTHAVKEVRRNPGAYPSQIPLFD